MDFKLSIPSAMDFFASLVQEGDDFPLLEAAICIAQDDYPNLDTEQTISLVETMRLKLKSRLQKQNDHLSKLRVLNMYFYDELGFAGNVNNYDDPQNSFIHRVIETRRGIPITLAVLWLELAKGIGLRASGISFPGHFLMKIELPDPHEGQVVMDPFTGASLSRDEIAERLIPWLTQSEQISIPGGVADETLAHFLESANSKEIVTRMLNNLYEIYRRQYDTKRIQGIQARLKILGHAI
jgi:regulator of sirC expression with transglutaminase-like and TPR domain